MILSLTACRKKEEEAEMDRGFVEAVSEETADEMKNDTLSGYQFSGSVKGTFNAAYLNLEDLAATP